MFNFTAYWTLIDSQNHSFTLCANADGRVEFTAVPALKNRIMSTNQKQESRQREKQENRVKFTNIKKSQLILEQ